MGASCSAPERAGCSGCAPILCGEAPAPEATLFAESRAVLPPRCASPGPRLTVPPVFSRFQFSVIYTQLGATQGTLLDQQRAMLQAILKQFTKELSAGHVLMGVLDASGGITEFACSLDKDLTQLIMRPVAGAASVASSPRGGIDLHLSAAGASCAADATGGAGGCQALMFREIERVLSPEEVRNLPLSNDLVLVDECCATVVIAGQRFLTFKLESAAAREYLMLCLQVLRMSQDKARMWYA